MKIQQSELKLGSEHQLLQESTLKLQLSLSAETANAFAKQLTEQISAMRAPAARSPDEPEALTVEKTKAQRFQSLLELLFGDGQPCEQSSTPAVIPDMTAAASDQATAPNAGTKLQLLAFEHVRESEQCRFAASGKVCLADGSSRQFAVNYELARSSETTRALGAEWVNLQDPLVLDWGAPSAKLGSHSVQFDLDNDGQQEWIRMPAATSAFLFLDRNRNGVADNGSELFGPKSGHGFAELAALDEDGNGWIDQGDSAFKDLKLWQAALQGDSVQTLGHAGVGALAVAAVSTEFSLKEQGDVLGQIRASSVWLGEQSGAGVVRQIDLATKRI